MRYWWHDGPFRWWSTDWYPKSHLVVIDLGRYLDWMEGTYVWDRKDVRR